VSGRKDKKGEATDLIARFEEGLISGKMNVKVASFVPRYRKLLRQGRVGRGEAPFEALLDQAIEAVLNTKYRPLLSDRLRRQAWLLAQLYEEEEMSLQALAAAAAIEEGVIVEHPLLRGMMDRSLLNAIGRYQ